MSPLPPEKNDQKRKNNSGKHSHLIENQLFKIHINFIRSGNKEEKSGKKEERVGNKEEANRNQAETDRNYNHEHK